MRSDVSSLTDARNVAAGTRPFWTGSICARDRSSGKSGPSGFVSFSASELDAVIFALRARSSGSSRRTPGICCPARMRLR